jgi:hypothetical protein
MNNAKYDGRHYYVILIKHVLNISVRLNRIKAKGKMVKGRKGVYK